MTSRRVEIQWNLRQLLASRGIFHTTELLPLLAERGVNLSRQFIYKLVTTSPQRINTDLLAALCDILECTPNDLLQLVVVDSEQSRTGTDERATESRGIGELRPIRATIRRPHESTE